MTGVIGDEAHPSDVCLIVSAVYTDQRGPLCCEVKDLILVICFSHAELCHLTHPSVESDTANSGTIVSHM